MHIYKAIVSKDIKWTTHEKKQTQYWTSYKEICDIMVHKNIRRLRIVFSCFVIICKQSAEYFTVSGKSIMWQIKSNGPMIIPWWTPESTVKSSD
jgi:hypothetical protein